MRSLLSLPRSKPRPERGSRVDLAGQTVTAPDGRVHAFDIGPFAKECLLNGLDELAYTLSQADQISAFENRYGRENS